MNLRQSSKSHDHFNQPFTCHQPNCLVKPTPTSSACGYPPCFALRRGLPRALATKAVMYQEGEISIAQCSKCQESFPVFTFVADTDMVTSGCVALTGLDKSIALTMQAVNESNEQLEARAGSNYKVILVRYQETPIPKGLSFQEFRKLYKPPTSIYTCIYCGCDSKTINHETKEQFLSHGKIEILHGS
jgi:hypothetical protein